MDGYGSESMCLRRMRGKIRVNQRDGRLFMATKKDLKTESKQAVQ